MRAILVMIMMWFVVGTAFAADRVPITPPTTCALTSEAHSRLLYNNTGTWASQSAVGGSTLQLFCGTNTPIGILYGDIWGYAPWGPFNDGGEVDVRGGLRNQLGPITLDFSVAWYHFKVQGIGTFDSINLRGKATYDVLEENNPVILQLYAILDYGYSIDLRADEVSIAGGVFAGYKIRSDITVGIAAEMWHHTEAAETVYSLGPKIVYNLKPDVDLYARALYTHGSINPIDPEENKASGTVGLTYRF